MQTYRVNELINLIHLAWLKESDMNLIPFLTKLGEQTGSNSYLKDLTDEILIYYLGMRDSDKKVVIPGIKKDHENDFKTSILKVSGINKD